MTILPPKFSFFSSTCRFLTVALVGGWLVSCGVRGPASPIVTQAMQGTRLADADELLKAAKRLTLEPETAAVYSLRAGEIAWDFLDTDGGAVSNVKALPLDQQHALKVLETATENLASHFTGSNYQPEKTFIHGGYSYRVDASRVKAKGALPLAKLVAVKPAREVPRKLCKNWHLEDGAGATFSPSWSTPNVPGMQRFISSSRGYLEPITGVLSFDTPAKKGGVRTASLTGYDPTMVSRVRLGATDYPLAADFTAPIVEQTRDIHELRIALQGLILPDVLDAKLIMLEPYSPQRIPIVLVHGLSSHPRMWKDVINDLRADPQLRGRYQFMVFYYPTGWPISYSAMRLREELAALEHQLGKPKNMVLVGHSMGGILARMQVISPGNVIWDTQLEENAQRLDRKLPSNHLFRRMLRFKPNQSITREIYICTPHRGSSLADLSLTNWFVKIFSLPTKITGAILDLPGMMIEPAKMTSVKGLSPTNPLYEALDQIPILVPHHTIVGDRGKGDTPNSSDGVVRYGSSHLASAESEVIVPDGHGGFKHPLATQELRRILLLHAGVDDSE